MEASSEKKVILIVDDEISNVKAFSHMLRNEYDVHVVTDPHEAVAAAEKYLPDMILLDIVMPELDGYAVFAQLRKNEKTKGISIIFLTSKNDPEDETRGLEMGATDYIMKPFSSGILLRRLKLHLLLESHKLEHGNDDEDEDDDLLI